MERKIAASLNDIYEEDAYIVKHLPEDGVSKIIKSALVLYYRVQNAEVMLTTEMAPPEPSPIEPALTAMMEALLAGVAALGSGMSTLVVEMGQQRSEAATNTQAIVQAVQSIQVTIPLTLPTNGSNGHHSASDDDRESLDDPLVQNMIGISTARYSG